MAVRFPVVEDAARLRGAVFFAAAVGDEGGRRRVLAGLAALLVSASAAACAPSASASFCCRLATDLPRLFASLTAWAWSESMASNLTWARFASLERRRRPFRLLRAGLQPLGLTSRRLTVALRSRHALLGHVQQGDLFVQLRPLLLDALGEQVDVLVHLVLLSSAADTVSGRPWAPHPQAVPAWRAVELA